MTDAIKLAIDALEEALYHGNQAFTDKVTVALAALREQPDHSESETVCYEACQAVGVMLSDLGIFDTPQATKLLDNLSQAKMVHADVLPWESVKPDHSELVNLSDAQIISIAYDCNALPEVITDTSLLVFARAIVKASAIEGKL